MQWLTELYTENCLFIQEKGKGEGGYYWRYKEAMALTADPITSQVETTFLGQIGMFCYSFINFELISHISHLKPLVGNWARLFKSVELEVFGIYGSVMIHLVHINQII